MKALEKIFKCQEVPISTKIRIMSAMVFLVIFYVVKVGKVGKNIDAKLSLYLSVYHNTLPRLLCHSSHDSQHLKYAYSINSGLQMPKLF